MVEYVEYNARMKVHQTDSLPIGMFISIQFIVNVGISSLAVFSIRIAVCCHPLTQQNGIVMPVFLI